jgi:hypothetical protein
MFFQQDVIIFNGCIVHNVDKVPEPFLSAAHLH